MSYLGKTVLRKYPFVSKTNPSKSYECVAYTDGTLSCNCPGWTRRNVQGTRECKHTMLVEQMRRPAPTSPTDLKPAGTRRILT